MDPEIDFFPWYREASLSTLAACTRTGSSITVTSGADILCGTGGNDRLYGEAGPDALQGRRGTDTCVAGTDGARKSTCEA